MDKKNNTQTGSTLVFNSVLLLIYLAGAGYFFFALATSRPHVGSWPEIFLLILLPAICFRSFLVFSQLIYKKQIIRRWLPRIASVITGIFIAGQLIQLETGMATDRFTHAYQPLVSTMESGQIESCEQSGDKLNIPDTVRPKVKRKKIFGRVQWTADATVYFSDKNFIISVPGSSVDIDGSRLYYDSKGKKWQLFHNDREEEIEKFSKLTEDSVLCVVPES